MDRVVFRIIEGRDTVGINPNQAVSSIMTWGTINHHVVDDVYSVGYKVGDEIHYGFYRTNELVFLPDFFNRIHEDDK